MVNMESLSTKCTRADAGRETFPALNVKCFPKVGETVFRLFAIKEGKNHGNCMCTVNYEVLIVEEWSAKHWSQIFVGNSRDTVFLFLKRTFMSYCAISQLCRAHSCLTLLCLSICAKFSSCKMRKMRKENLRGWWPRVDYLMFKRWNLDNGSTYYLPEEGGLPEHGGYDTMEWLSKINILCFKSTKFECCHQPWTIARWLRWRMECSKKIPWPLLV